MGVDEWKTTGASRCEWARATIGGGVVARGILLASESFASGGDVDQSQNCLKGTKSRFCGTRGRQFYLSTVTPRSRSTMHRAFFLSLRIAAGTLVSLLFWRRNFSSDVSCPISAGKLVS